MTFSEYIRRKVIEDAATNGVDLPTPLSAPAEFALRNAVDDWFELQDQFREQRKLKKAIEDQAFKERMAPIRAAKRRRMDAERKVAKRAAGAAARGADVRHRTDCSAMTDEERLLHRRAVERAKKARQRASKRLDGNLTDEQLELLDNYDRDFGRF